MFLTRRPPPERIDRFLRESRDLPLSYSPTGIVSTHSLREGVDEATAVIGHGKAALDRARAALMTWKQFDIGWIETFPRDALVAAGAEVALLIRHFGFWSLNGCRVLHAVDSVTDGDRCGVAYGTLTNHAESGEELFEVFIDPQTDDVIYRIRAISWPQATLARVGQPVVRMLQERFRRHSAAAMTRATRSKGGRA
jgi:uncharacterized protein (UPF0548 family)